MSTLSLHIGIMCHTSLGGSVRIARELALALAQRGHEIHLITPAIPQGSWDTLDNHLHHHVVGSNLYSNRHPASLYTTWTKEELLKFTTQVCCIIISKRLEILHFHYAVPFAQVAAHIRIHLGDRCPQLVGTLHGTDVTILGRDPVIGPQLSSALQAVNGLTTVSHCYARLAQETFCLPNLPKVIPNFINQTQFDVNNVKNAFPCQHHRPRLIHISNFRLVKNPQAIAHIFLALRQRIDAELWLIGSGPELPAIKEIIERSSYQSDVTFWGVQKDVAPLLAQTDLMLITSQQESFCLAALEAMSLGVPVLASKVGGLPELIHHQVNGLLFLLDDLPSAVEMAVNLLTQPTQYQAMRAAAIAQAQQYDHKKVIPLYEDYYQTLLNNVI
ncbi:MAG TPA: N-acetyl-alpha-D-glucosaminyl L-malate synthase BshA [Cyanobacteria bacterium UBA11372]|nr:N-acetyl-alpha-D-glucosaminyl L-malate synthase BshA [Cyanobacteria bacterium UBA11372]